MALPVDVVDRISAIDETAPDADLRPSFIGGSEAFELLNRPQYGRGCARALAQRKRGDPEDVPTAHNKERAMKMRGILDRGHRLEDFIADEYMKLTHRKLIKRTRLVRNPDHPGAGVHTDRIILSDGIRPTGDAEIKSHAEGPFLHILRDGLPDGHNLQLQWSLFCSGHTWGAFIMLGVFGEMPLKHFDRERDEELMEIFARETDNFWNLLARGELPPRLADPRDVRCKACHFRLTCRGEALDPEEYARLIDQREGRKILTPMANDELEEMVIDRALVKSEIDALDSTNSEEPGTLQILNKRILDVIGDQDSILLNGRWKIYAPQNTWSGLDTQRLRIEQPQLYDRYFVSHRPTGSRKLTIYAMHNWDGDK